MTTEEEPTVTEHDRDDIGAHRFVKIITDKLIINHNGSSSLETSLEPAISFNDLIASSFVILVESYQKEIIIASYPEKDLNFVGNTISFSL